MSQSRALSFVEAVTNIVVGYLVALLAQLLVFPFFGIEVGLAENLAIGGIFITVSLARSYLLRRLFERLRSPAPDTPRLSEVD